MELKTVKNESTIKHLLTRHRCSLSLFLPLRTEAVDVYRYRSYWECRSSVVLSHERCSFVMAPLAVRSHGDGLSEPIVVFCCWAQMAVITASTARASYTRTTLLSSSYICIAVLGCIKRRIRGTSGFGWTVGQWLFKWKENLSYTESAI
jgi:hypothetical protein